MNSAMVMQSGGCAHILNHILFAIVFDIAAMISPVVADNLVN